MSKPTLKEPYRIIEMQAIETMMAGVKSWTGSSFPQSYSDMQACARALLQMFEVKRRPVAFVLPLEGEDAD